MKQYLEIGKIVAIFGIKGEVKVQPWCDSPEFLAEFDTLYDKDGAPVEIVSARAAKNVTVMKLAGVDTVAAAQALIGRVLYINRDDVELDEGCYFIQDLIGLRAENAQTGEVYGVLSDVSQTGAADIYHIKTADGRELLFPAAGEFVEETDLEGGVIRILPPEGLFDAL
ncbi:MAG: ribosome maturation factor RimM [Oscillospiraceae bacterium]